MGIFSFFRKKPEPVVITNWNLNGSYMGLPVIVQSSSAYGGAIFGLLWGGYQFVNPEGHGGQLQSAWQSAEIGPAWNPTEAGSQADGDGQTSTTRVLSAQSDGTTLRTSVNPALWTPYEGKAVSDDVFNKIVTLGYRGLPNVLHHQMTVISAAAYKRWSVEGLCCYLPFAMTQWWQFDPADGKIEQTFESTAMITSPNNCPVIAADNSGHAMGCYHPAAGQLYLYGMDHQYPKWDCAFFELPEVAAGQQISWEAFTVFGTLEDVRQTMVQLHRMAVTS